MRKPTGFVMLLAVALSAPAIAQAQAAKAAPQTPAKKSAAAPKAKQAKAPQLASAAVPAAVSPVPVSPKAAQPGASPAPAPAAPPPAPVAIPAPAAPAPPATPEAPAAPPYAAPKPGHPLNPADVDTLTGKNKPSGYSATPYVVVDPATGGYGYGAYGRGGYGRGSIFTTPGEAGSRFSTPPSGSYAGFAPVAIGRANGETFVVIGGGSGRFPFVIAPRGRAGRPVFFLPRSGFFFF